MENQIKGKATWSKMRACRRLRKTVFITLLFMLSLVLSFFYHYLTIFHPNQASPTTQFFAINSQMQDIHSYNSSIYFRNSNNISPAKHIEVSVPKNISQNRNTRASTASNNPFIVNTKTRASGVLSQVPNIKVISGSTKSNVKNIKTTGTDQHLDQSDTRKSHHKSGINSMNRNFSVYINTAADASTSPRQNQLQGTSNHTALPGSLNESEIQCKEQYQEEGPKRQVVLWTPFWHTWDGWTGMLRDHMQLKKGRCATWRCEFLLGQNLTMDQVKNADAVIFFSLDVLRRPLPPRSPKALWIWLELEAPPISQSASKAWDKIEQKGVFFNLTMSYHHLNPVIALFGQLVPLSVPQYCPLPSTFYLDTSSPTYNSYSHHMQMFDVWHQKEGNVVDEKLQAERKRRYGGFIYKTLNNTKDSRLSQSEFEKNKQTSNDVPFLKYGEMTLTAEEIALASRPRMAAWMASHCPTVSRRESVVASLRRFMNITTVGKCGEIKCGKNHMDIHCYKWLAASHLFYFSFENALCDDYRTEKLWRPLEYGMVPVVYGGPNYRHNLPFGSYIDVSNFSSPAALAKHLLYLASHPTAYLRYLQWRRYWRVIWPVHWCHLCEVIHKQTNSNRTTMKQWWNTTTTCYDPLSW